MVVSAFNREWRSFIKTLAENSAEKLTQMSGIIRTSVLDMYTVAGGGHYGGSMSVVEILVSLYGSVLRYDPTNPGWEDRDRLILSKGHASGTLCAVLGHFGFFDKELLETFNKLDSPLGMHPDMHKIPGCDMSSGSLGHGLAIGCGMALAGKADHKDYRVYVVMGDGECQEGTVWEAAMVAAHHKLDNMIAIIDRNMVSLDGETEEINALEPFAPRWKSFGWHVIEVDGHDIKKLLAGFQEAAGVTGKPIVIIARTVKGKGISFMEGDHEYHYASLSDEKLEQARQELGRELK